MAVVDAALDVKDDSVEDAVEWGKKFGCGGLIALSFPSATKSVLEPKEWQYTVDVIAKRYAYEGLCEPPRHGIPAFGIFRTSRDLQFQG